jgi:hypothetical protein
MGIGPRRALGTTCTASDGSPVPPLAEIATTLQE